MSDLGPQGSLHRPSRAVQGAQASLSRGTKRALIIAFFVAISLPIEPMFGDVRLSASRLYVMLLGLPFLISYLSGKAGRKTASDMAMVAFAVWMVMTFVIHHGASRLPYAVISAAELVGGYLAGRLLVRNAEDYRFFFASFLWMIALLVPVAVIEVVSGRALISLMFERFVPVTLRFAEIRNGFYRAGVSTPHPIHWGLICALAFAQAWIIWGRLFAGRLLRGGLVIVGTLTALSSAPLLALGLQIGLIVWGALTKNRWMPLIWLIVVCFVALEFLSNRGPFILLIETMTFDSTTAWWRVYVWIYGTQNVMDNPWIGLGLNDWVRPEWLAPTVDNFWLLISMRHGLPALAFLVASVAFNVAALLRVRNLGEDEAAIRQAYLIAIAALCLMLCTVHVWGSPSVLVMFLFGCASFLYTGGASDSVAPDQADKPDQRTRRTRFPRPRGR